MKSDKELNVKAHALLRERGIEIEDIADLVMHLQSKYIPDLTLEECIESIEQVLAKREVQNTIITGIELDMLAEKELLSQPLNDILTADEGLYGIDEILALSIVNVFGSIGFTNYGYLDKVKPGIIQQLDNKDGKTCNTFLDDIVGAIAAAAASRIAHGYPDKQAGEEK
ncbi:phosphatidylglycerophosphatase A [Streptococcus minor]|uniref:Phosphatidylglycerophosphatase A n=1 Tax=Streptococcus minor TaxID=229549 RepID=A0A3P1VG76_9STRE|nr:phosphatidylglycerophosphatase A [Streptococcus minor]RRD32698.1 phosphatidylglycerophosphatase A [Streptococcus minor]